MAKTKPSPDNPEQPKTPRRRGQIRAETQTQVQGLKEKLVEMRNLFYTVLPQEITQSNISDLQRDILIIIQDVRKLESVPDANTFFNGIDAFKYLLMDVQSRLATQYMLFERPIRTKNQFDEFFGAYNTLERLISEAINLIN